MKMKLAFLCLAMFPTALLAQDVVTEQILRAYCETPPYWPGGGGKNCHSEWHEMAAPSGFVFAKSSLQGGMTSRSGNEHYECTIEWLDDREVIPGIMQPSRVRWKAYGEMNHGSGAGGHTRCEYSVSLVRLP